MDYQILAREAIKAKSFAYPKYSNFHVGAALLTMDDKIIHGCNIESSSYGLTICAERTAIFKAYSDGIRAFKAIAIASDDPGFISPCGACRQIISDLCGEIDVIFVNQLGEIKVFKTSELIPFAFNDSSLKNLNKIKE
jgi:cytidine deaminase